MLFLAAPCSQKESDMSRKKTWKKLVETDSNLRHVDRHVEFQLRDHSIRDMSFPIATEPLSLTVSELHCMCIQVYLGHD